MILLKSYLCLYEIKRFFQASWFPCGLHRNSSVLYVWTFILQVFMFFKYRDNNTCLEVRAESFHLTPNMCPVIDNHFNADLWGENPDLPRFFAKRIHDINQLGGSVVSIAEKGNFANNSIPLSRCHSRSRPISIPQINILRMRHAVTFVLFRLNKDHTNTFRITAFLGHDCCYQISLH